MDVLTRDTLLQLNRRFYDRHADAFSLSRARPWPGWDRLLTLLPRAPPLRVLDVGCGNGRFGAFLLAQRGRAIRYVGLDASEALLGDARRRLSQRLEVLELHLVEVMSEDVVLLLAGRKFDLIALFGLLHHIPGLANRRQLLASLARHLTPGGVLALSFWQFETRPERSRKVLRWENYNRRLAVPIDLGQLEAGDTLLTFAGDAAFPRYCHRADLKEIALLLGAICPPLELTRRFDADGRPGEQNHYVILRRPTS